jgi:hypothetical protein
MLKNDFNSRSLESSEPDHPLIIGKTPPNDV